MNTKRTDSGLAFTRRVYRCQQHLQRIEIDRLDQVGVACAMRLSVGVTAWRKAFRGWIGDDDVAVACGRCAGQIVAALPAAVAIADRLEKLQPAYTSV